jgi:hypothetical protein
MEERTNPEPVSLAPVVLNTSPLIALEQLTHWPLLQERFPLY